MDQAQQREGEARVRRLLVEPLEQMGLKRPAGLTVAKFEEMKRSLCQILARMDDQNLQALFEICLENPGGKEKDRFPIAARVISFARPMMPDPDGDPSSLKRAVFSHETGRLAIEGGYAPELLSYVSRFSHRGFPMLYAIGQIQTEARPAIVRMADIEGALARGEDISASDREFRMQRLARIDRCREIRRIGLADKQRAGA